MSAFLWRGDGCSEASVDSVDDLPSNQPFASQFFVSLVVLSWQFLWLLVAMPIERTTHRRLRTVFGSKSQIEMDVELLGLSTRRSLIPRMIGGFVRKLSAKLEHFADQSVEVCLSKT